MSYPQKLPKFVHGFQQGVYSKEQIEEFAQEWWDHLPGKVAKGQETLDECWDFLGFECRDEYLLYTDEGANVEEILEWRAKHVTDKIVYGTAVTAEDVFEQDANKPLPGGWTSSDIDLSPWVQTMFWEVELRARRKLESRLDSVNGRKPCKVEISSGRDRILSPWTSITLVYPEFTNEHGRHCTVSNIWPFPIKGAPKALVERTVAALEKCLREAGLLEQVDG